MFLGRNRLNARQHGFLLRRSITSPFLSILYSPPSNARFGKTEKGSERRRNCAVPFSLTGSGSPPALSLFFSWELSGSSSARPFRHEFVNYDDDHYVYENPRITNGLTLDGIQWAFTHVHADNWHPLTTISHMLDCQLYGLQPWGHHLTNVLLHAAAAIFLFLALWQLTGARWPSAFVAAVFAIHPLRVASVAWVAERKDVLSGVFFMLILWAYARYVRSSRPSSGRYTMVLVLFALGLMCKPTLVTLPFVLLLLDYWPLRRFALQSPSSKPPRSVRNHLADQRSENPSWGGPVPTKPVQYLLIEKIPFCALRRVVCGYAPGTGTGCDDNTPIDLRRPSWQCCRVLRCIPRPNDLAGGFGGVLSLSGRWFDHCAGNSCVSRPVDHFRGFLHLARQVPIFVDRLVVVFGDAGPDDWYCSSRGTGTGRPLHLPRPDWLSTFW